MEMESILESLSFWQLIHYYEHTESPLVQYEEKICTWPREAIAPMMKDGLSESAFRCDCAVASVMISWFLLDSFSSFLNSPANPMIEKSSLDPPVDQYSSEMVRSSLKPSRATCNLSVMVLEGIVTKASESASELPGDAARR